MKRAIRRYRYIREDVDREIKSIVVDYNFDCTVYFDGYAVMMDHHNPNNFCTYMNSKLSVKQSELTFEYCGADVVEDFQDALVDEITRKNLVPEHDDPYHYDTVRITGNYKQKYEMIVEWYGDDEEGYDPDYKINKIGNYTVRIDDSESIFPSPKPQYDTRYYR